MNLVLSENENSNVFSNIDSKGKAYLLGLIATSNFSKDEFSIRVKKYDRDILVKINKIFFNNKFKITTLKNMVTLSVDSKEIYMDLIRLFNIKNYIIQFPDITDKYLTYFIRGVFEGGSGNFKYKDNPVCCIKADYKFLEELLRRINIKADIINNMFELSGNKLLDFLYKIYKNVGEDNEIYFTNSKYKFYKTICRWVPKSLYFKYIKIDKDAIAPYKERCSDSGYDLHLIKKIKTNGNVEFYDTGIAVEASFGYYFDLVGRSSISKSGYMLANNIGIIDRTYTGSIIVPLIKIDKMKADLQLPCRLVQIIPRQIHHLDIMEVGNINETERGSNGFGSSG